jgi:hypothetical protein
MMKINFNLFFFWLVLLLALSACNSEPAQPTLDPTQGVQMLAGKYTTTITADDTGNFQTSSDPSLAMNQGDWLFTLSNDGKFSAEMDGNFMAAGKYTVIGDRIEVYIESSCEECGCINAIGRYAWVLNGNELSFAKTAGSCYGMELVLTSRPLTRQP